MTTLKLLLAFVLALVVTSPAHGSDAILIVAHPEAPFDRLSLDQLRPVFQTNRTTLAGKRLLPVNLPLRSSARTKFDEAVLNLSSERVQMYWIDRKIRGGNPPPRKLRDEALVVRAVNSRKGAIGYVTQGISLGKAKVVAKIVAGRVVAP